MRNISLALALVAATSAFALSTPAEARDLGAPLSKERFQVRLRAIDVIPDESSSVNIGGKIDIDNAIVPEVDLTYFFTPNLAAELIAATAKHDIGYTGNTALGDAWILPPTVTLQYHFTPDSKFSPYVGAGLNYSLFYSEEAATGFTDLDVDGGVGYALQAGADYWINDHWGVNLDVKKLWLNIDASLNNNSITADVDLDPWIVGAGVSYRF